MNDRSYPRIRIRRELAVLLGGILAVLLVLDLMNTLGKLLG